jgi:hypothetical protein
VTGKLDDPEWRRERARKAGRARWARADRKAESDAARARLYARFAESPDPDPARTAAMARMTLLSLMAANRRKREVTEAPPADTS